MRYAFIPVLLLLCCSTFAEEEQVEDFPERVAALRIDSKDLIGGILSPIGGYPVLKKADFIVKGAEDIALNRTYHPPQIPFPFPRHWDNQEKHNKKFLHQHLDKNYREWVYFPHTKLNFYPGTKQVRIYEPSGIAYEYRLEGEKTKFITKLYAISNFSSEEPSGKYDPRNAKISFDGQKIVSRKKLMSLKMAYLSNGMSLKHWRLNSISTLT